MNQELTILFTHGWENCTINGLKTWRFKNEQYISLNVDYTCIGILTISWLYRHVIKQTLRNLMGLHWGSLADNITGYWHLHPLF